MKKLLLTMLLNFLAANCLANPASKLLKALEYPEASLSLSKTFPLSKTLPPHIQANYDMNLAVKGAAPGHSLTIGESYKAVFTPGNSAKEGTVRTLENSNNGSVIETEFKVPGSPSSPARAKVVVDLVTMHLGLERTYVTPAGPMVILQTYEVR